MNQRDIIRAMRGPRERGPRRPPFQDSIINFFLAAVIVGILMALSGWAARGFEIVR